VIHVAGATTGGHVAANRPQPETSPASQPAPRATGVQPITARPIRATPVGWSSSSQPRIDAITASVDRSGPSSAGRDGGADALARGALARGVHGAESACTSGSPAVASHHDAVVWVGSGGVDGSDADRSTPIVDAVAVVVSSSVRAPGWGISASSSALG
jgi:hypothetical protein